MGFMESLAEARILAAQEEGLFDNLSGAGKPLDLEDGNEVPDDLRLAFKILRNAGCLPEEMERRKEIYGLRQLIACAIDETTRRELRRELNLLMLRDALLSRR